MATKARKKNKLTIRKTKSAAANKTVKKGAAKACARRVGASNKGKAAQIRKAKSTHNQLKKKSIATASVSKRKNVAAHPTAASRTSASDAAGAKKKVRVAAEKSVAAKVVARTSLDSVGKATAKSPSDRIAGLEKDIAKVRNEFKTILKSEISAAFEVCLSAMEQAANLMESRLVTVLGEMSNLVTGAKPDFKDGKLKSVVSDDGNERTDFSYGNDGLVTSRTYRGGKLKFEIVHGKLGNPISGKMFDPSGKVVKEFSYGPDGQVK